MKTYALVVFGILASSPLAALAESNQENLIELNAAQMDAVTAGMFTLPEPFAAITAAAEAFGRQAMTGTTTSTTVLGSNEPTAYGRAWNFVIASSALATATGDNSRSTSFETSDDTNGTTPLGVVINRSMTVGPTTITGYSSVQPTGLLTYNFLQRGIGRFW
jgi:hypothetical protein